MILAYDRGAFAAFQRLAYTPMRCRRAFIMLSLPPYHAIIFIELYFRSFDILLLLPPLLMIITQYRRQCADDGIDYELRFLRRSRRKDVCRHGFWRSPAIAAPQPRADINIARDFSFRHEPRGLYCYRRAISLCSIGSLLASAATPTFDILYAREVLLRRITPKQPPIVKTTFLFYADFSAAALLLGFAGMMLA